MRDLSRHRKFKQPVAEPVAFRPALVPVRESSEIVGNVRFSARDGDRLKEKMQALKLELEKAEEEFQSLSRQYQMQNAQMRNLLEELYKQDKRIAELESIEIAEFCRSLG